MAREFAAARPDAPLLMRLPMSAFGGKADSDQTRLNVCFWPKADMDGLSSDVCPVAEWHPIKACAPSRKSISRRRALTLQAGRRPSPCFRPARKQNLQFMELESVEAVVAAHNATYSV
jgi:hypothetical protein